MPHAMSALWPMIDARHAREREPADLERAGARDRAAVQAVLDPHPGLADGQVRVVREEGLARGGARPGDHPGVGADALTPAEQLWHGVERALHRGIGLLGRPGDEGVAPDAAAVAEPASADGALPDAGAAVSAEGTDELAGRSGWSGVHSWSESIGGRVA